MPLLRKTFPQTSQGIYTCQNVLNLNARLDKINVKKHVIKDHETT